MRRRGRALCSLQLLTAAPALRDSVFFFVEARSSLRTLSAQPGLQQPSCALSASGSLLASALPLPVWNASSQIG